MRFGGTESAERFMREQRWPRDQYAIEREDESLDDRLANARAQGDVNEIAMWTHKIEVRDTAERLAVAEAAVSCDVATDEAGEFMLLTLNGKDIKLTAAQAVALAETLDTFMQGVFVGERCEQCGEVFAGPTCVDCSDGD